MPKEFYTERDIEDMVKRGVLSLEINENVVLTDLAYEKANRLGMKLVRQKAENPPSAPVRPYLSPPQTRQAAAPPQPASVPPPVADGASLHQRIKDAVIARLGTQVDASLLDAIIRRVLDNTGMK